MPHNTDTKNILLKHLHINNNGSLFSLIKRSDFLLQLCWEFIRSWRHSCDLYQQQACNRCIYWSTTETGPLTWSDNHISCQPPVLRECHPIDRWRSLSDFYYGLLAPELATLYSCKYRQRHHCRACDASLSEVASKTGTYWRQPSASHSPWPNWLSMEPVADITPGCVDSCSRQSSRIRIGRCRSLLALSSCPYHQFHWSEMSLSRRRAMRDGNLSEWLAWWWECSKVCCLSRILNQTNWASKSSGEC